ncbi:SCO2322 family protein [Streptomyces sp. NPDC006134]|uniref:SCO2322 family protein n=1 Tax=Streptomyces sp. NPDC006134 TaxID=3154467 RepID=UPI0033DC4744
MIRRAALLALTALVLLAGAGQAQAAGYRYWSFWEREGDRWTYATQGPSTARPDDGDVQGFRFAVSEDSGDAARPRGAADFASVCGGTPAHEGSKRVALVLDFGTAADAPSGETPPGRRTACARVSPGATTADALAAVAGPLRYDANALLCAIAGYPRKGCGEQVAEGGKEQKQQKEQKEQGDPEKDESGPSAGLLAGVGLVVVLGGAAVWQARRRRKA